jgi:hypothetical protein
MMKLRRSRYGPAHDVGHEVGRHGRARALDGDGRARLQLLLGHAGKAVDEVLADQRLRQHLAAHVLAQRAEAGLVDAEGDDRALALAVQADLGDLARAHAGDLQVAPVLQAEGVVEDDLVLALGRAAAAGAAAAHGGQAGDEAREEHDDRDAPHWPGSTCPGSQLWSGVGFHGFDLSGATNSAAPGQRLRWPVAVVRSVTALRSGTGIGLTTPSTVANALT